MKNKYTLDAKRYELIIGWLYPELMSTYGDRGNITVLEKRCEWRGIQVEIKKLDSGFKIEDLKMCDLLFMGGAQDKQQQIVASDLTKEKIKTLKEMIDSGIPGLYICGAYQFLGKYYKEANGKIIKGLNILDLYTENPGVSFPRLIGNAVVEADGLWQIARSSNPTTSYQLSATRLLVGFENHGGRTYLGKNVKPLGKVIKGFGNNGIDKTEGVIYKNTFGTYLHGPILPKNPHFADYLIKLALEKKYGVSPINLFPIDDKLEHQSRNIIAQRLGVKL